MYMIDAWTRQTYRTAGDGKASVAGAEGTVSDGGALRRYGSRDLGDTEVMDGGEGCDDINKNNKYVLVRRRRLVFARRNHYMLPASLPETPSPSLLMCLRAESKSSTCCAESQQEPAAAKYTATPKLFIATVKVDNHAMSARISNVRSSRSPTEK